MRPARLLTLALALALAGPAAGQRMVPQPPWWTGNGQPPHPCTAKPGGPGKCANGNWVVTRPDGGTIVNLPGGRAHFVPPTLDPEAETDGGAA